MTDHEPFARLRLAPMLATCLSALSLGAQVPEPEQRSGDPTATERRLWDTTLEQLRRRDPQGFLATPERRIEQLRSFLERLPELSVDPDRFGPRERLRCEAWSRLATLYLTRRQGDRARQAFARLEELAGSGRLDLRGRARFGIAQSHEAQGRVETAREHLERLAEDPEFTGTRYADWARSALSRLGEGCEIGAAARDFGPRRDLSDQVRTLHALDGRPVLLLFGSAEDPKGLRRLDRALRAGRDAGLSPEQMPLLLTDVFEKDRAVRLAATRQWQQPVLPSSTAFIDRTLLDYRVTTLPAWVLIGPDGRLLSRDAPPHRLAEILGRIPVRD